ncbi:unnamed protein product [Laminaria digitata]
MLVVWASPTSTLLVVWASPTSDNTSTLDATNNMNTRGNICVYHVWGVFVGLVRARGKGRFRSACASTHAALHYRTRVPIIISSILFWGGVSILSTTTPTVCSLPSCQKHTWKERKNLIIVSILAASFLSFFCN